MREIIHTSNPEADGTDDYDIEGDTYPRLRVNVNHLETSIQMGSGSAPVDTEIKRTGPGQLTIGGSLTDRVVVVSASTATTDLDMSQGSVFKITVTHDTTFTVTGALDTIVATLALYLIADGTPRSITWPTGTVWPSGASPTLSTAAGKTDLVTLESFDGGATWYGILAALDLR